MISLDLRLGVGINDVTLKRRRGAISVGIKRCRIEKKSSFEKLDLIFTLQTKQTQIQFKILFVARAFSHSNYYR